VDMATLGSCSSVPSEPVLWNLIPYRRIMVAYDMDRSGGEGAPQSSVGTDETHTGPIWRPHRLPSGERQPGRLAPLPPD